MLFTWDLNLQSGSTKSVCDSHMLNFRSFGSGPNFIILHGLYGASDNWLGIGKKLENHFTVYMVDLRNHGGSPHFDSHTYNDMSEDLSLFFKENNIKKATVLGHSMGGKVAMMFAANYPELIDKLIVADIAPKDYSLDLSKPQSIIHYNILSALNRIDFSKIKSRNQVNDHLSGEITSVSLRGFLLKNLRKTKSGLYEWKINVPVLKQYLPLITTEVNYDFFDERRPILQYPVTFIRGLNSDYITDEDITKIKGIYPNAIFIDIKDAGHWLHAEQPDKFIEAVVSV